MSASFTRKARYLTFGGIATLALGIAAQLAVVPGASSTEGSTYPLHQTPPITNSGFEDQSGETCPGSPDQWGWHFVVTGGGEFESLTVTFDDAGTITLGDGDFGPPSDKHAYVYTETDDTLLSASAKISNADDKTKFVLSHTCAGDNNVPSPSPSVTPTCTDMPSASVSPSESASPECSPSPSESVSPTESESVSPTESESVTPTESESVSPTESESVSPTESESVSPTESESVSPTESESVSPTESESVSPTESESVLPTRFTNSPSESETVDATDTATPGPTVSGVKVVRPGALPSTGTPFPVGLLLLLGVGMVVGGLVITVTGEAHPAGGRHRR